VSITADNAYVSGITVDGATGDGIEIHNILGENWTKTTIENNRLSNNGANGVIASVDTGSSIANVVFKTNVIANNVNNGAFVAANSGSIINNALLEGNISTGNGYHGVVTWSTGAGSFIDSTIIKNNQSSGNTLNGIQTRALLNGQMNVVLNEGNISNNNQQGFYVISDSSAVSFINKVTFNNNISNNNGNSGFRSDASIGATISEITYNGNIADGNNVGFYALRNGGTESDIVFNNNTARNTTVQQGFRVQANNAGTSIDVDFNNNLSENTASYGFYIFGDADGVINEANFDSNVSTDNAVGYYAYARNNGSINAAKFENNISANNSSRGFMVDDNSVTGSIIADLGGGVLGSTGGNSIYNNTGEELLVDLDGGELKAENNWWGSAGGLAPAELDLQDASTADTTPFLTADPD